MSNLPKGWKVVVLQDLKGENKNSFIDGDWIEAPYIAENGVRLIQTGNIGIGRFINKNKKYISEESFTELNCKEVKENDILICRLAEPVGRSCIVPSIEKSLTAVDITIFRPDNKRVNSEFINYFLNYEPQLSKANNLASGTTRKRISRSNLGKMEIPLPPIEEQKKIADILSTVDKKIAFVEENINATEELKKGLMQKLLTEGIGHTEFKDSELGTIPESWEVVQFDKVCDIRDGTHDSPKYIESGIPFITSKHLTDNGIDFTETNYISKENHIEFSKRSKVDNGDILFGMIGTIGKPIIVNTDFEFSIKNIALLKLSCNELLSNIYVLNLLKSNIITKQFSKLSNGGVQSFIALGMIRKLKIPLPPLEEQKQIAEILSTVDSKLENLKDKKLFFEELKKGLMQKLLTGEVRV